jgi:tetratricopeptide (TPR) repeat protein
VALSLNLIGEAYNTIGKAKEALNYYKQAYEIRKNLYGDKHADVAISLNNVKSALTFSQKRRKRLNI